MRLNNTLFLLANLLAVKGHIVKRDLFNSNKIEIYKNKVPTSFEQIVKDAVNGNRTYYLEKSTLDITEENLISIPKGKYIKAALDDPFNLNVHCFNQNSCGDYPEKVQEGAYYVSNALEFYNSVNVNVTIFPFCNYIEDGSCSSIMGITYPPTFVPLKETDDSEEFLYPQALVKQLNLNSGINYEQIDFVVYLNSNYSPDADHDNRSLIAAHEILHGLGFFHQINPVSVYISNYQNMFTQDFAIPPIQYVEEGTVIKYQGWTPFSIFDKYIVGTANPDEYLYQKLTKFRDHSINFEVDSERTTQKQYNTFVNTFKELASDREATPGGVEVARLFKTLNAVGFRTKDGSVVELQTFDGTYESASSISHINVPFACKNSGTCSASGKYPEENYLMYFTVISKASTDKLINAFKSKSKHDLIGPNIIKIMTTIGWNEKDGDNNNDDSKYTVSTGSYYQSGSIHSTSSTSIMIILSIAFLCISYLI